MEIVNNSTIDSVIDYANVKFGLELNKDDIAEQLKGLSFGDTLGLLDSIKKDDDDKFSSIIDLSRVNEGWARLPDMDKEKYQARDGLEGPIMTKSGKVVYYDNQMGQYYDPDTDIYLSYDEWKALDDDKDIPATGAMDIDRIKDLAGIKKEDKIDEYGTINTAKPSNATIRASNNGNDQRDFSNAQQDAKRDSSNPQRFVAGSNKQATGQGASRAGSADPDDIERADNRFKSDANQQQSNINAQEIERLKQLAMGGR
jgi:hypothetical protein